jgi:cystine transport system permease protein
MPAWLLLMAHSLQPLLYAGLVFTVPLTLASFAIGIVVAFIVALVRLFGPRWAVACVRFYVWLFRGSPLLVQLFVIFYGLPNVGIVLDPLTAAIIGFSLNVGAYNSEVIRGVIESIPKGQWEAAYSMGMTRQQRDPAAGGARRAAAAVELVHCIGEGHLARCGTDGA